MKFLIAGNTLPGGTFDRDKIPAIRKALAGKEHKIIDLLSFNNDKEAHSILRGDIKGWFAKQDLKELNRKFIQRVQAFKPDILVLGSIDMVSLFMFPETIKRLRWDMSVVCLFGDDEFMLNRHAHWVGRFDKNIAAVKWCADYYNNIVPGSTYYMPWGVDFHERDFDKLQCESEYDAIFVGNPFGNRPELLEEIVCAGGVNLAIFGNEKWQGYPRLKEYHKGFLTADMTSEEIRKAKMVLCFTEDHLTGANHMNASIWLAIKEGRLPICTEYPVLEDYGLAVPTYSSPAELTGVIKYYLDSPNERQFMAMNLFGKVKEEFDFVNIFRDMFDSLENEFK